MKVIGNLPMSLQSITPLRNMLSPVPSEEIEDVQTPLALRAALGMSPAVNGTRSQTQAVVIRRPSLDPLQRCKGELIACCFLFSNIEDRSFFQ